MHKKVGNILIFTFFLFFFIPSAFSSAFIFYEDAFLSAKNFKIHSNSQNPTVHLVDFGDDDGSSASDKVDPDEENMFDDDKVDPDDMEEEPGGEDDSPEGDYSEEKTEDEGEPEKEDPDEAAEDESGEEPETPEEGGESDCPGNSVAFCLGFSSIPESYFGTTFSLDGSYRNYFRYPVYWLCGGGIGRGSPNGDYPYTYQVGGDNLAAPSFYSTCTYGGAGLVYNNVEKGFSVFSEFVMGLSLRILYNGSIKHAHSGKLYPSVFGDFSVGGSWRWLRASMGVQYDTNWNFVFGGKIGVAIPIEMFKKLKKQQ